MTVLRQEPVLIGPICVGKTSVAAILANTLGVPHLEVDECAPEYYARAVDFDRDRAEALERDEGYVARYRYGEQIFPWLLGQVLTDHQDCVFDLGAGHTCLLDSSRQHEIEAALAAFSNVFLLLPSSNPDRSMEVIRERLLSDPDRRDHVWEYDDVNFISHWVRGDQNRRLATHIVFTDQREPAEIATEIHTRLLTGDRE